MMQVRQVRDDLLRKNWDDKDKALTAAAKEICDLCEKILKLQRVVSHGYVYKSHYDRTQREAIHKR